MSTNNSDNQFYNDIERQIKESLSKGLNTGDFSGLNSAITSSVKGVLKEASSTVSSSLRDAGVEIAESLKNAGPHYGYKKPHSTLKESQAYMAELQAKRAEREARKKAEAEKAAQAAAVTTSGNSDSTALSVNNKQLPANFVPVGRASGNACIATGTAGLALCSPLAVYNLAMFAFASASPVGFIVSSVFAAGSAVTLKYGLAKKGMLDRAKRYAQVCGSNMYAQVTALASSMGLKTAKVKKDLKKMLRKGYFPQGYLDDEETTLMLTNDIYKQYQQTKNYSLSATSEEMIRDLSAPSSEKAKMVREKLNPAQRTELEAMIAEGRDYINKLHELNDKIPGESITKKLNELENVLKEIFLRVEVYPEQMPRMHKLMEYYLPTMLKLVDAYREYDEISCPGEEIIKAKLDIESTLDTINEAFVQLLNNLFQDSVWDVTSDAQVLQTMLKQEGLAQDLKD